ncbi:hypothetical protein C8Q73DRAFT_778918 [Cubamyces lactineus]|nr:hypothetical protein C8Q73DRAFT_778918 [Cubamyces lactineus]
MAFNFSSAFDIDPTAQWGTPAPVAEPDAANQQQVFVQTTPQNDAFAQPPAPGVSEQDMFQQYLVQAVVNLGTRTEAAEQVVTQQLSVLQALQARLQDQASQNAKLNERVSQLQSTYAPNSSSSPSIPGASSGPRGTLKVEVDAMRRGPLSQTEKDRRRREGLCLYCGKAGHMISKCPNGAKPRADSKAPTPSGKA